MIDRTYSLAGALTGFVVGLTGLAWRLDDANPAVGILGVASHCNCYRLVVCRHYQAGGRAYSSCQRPGGLAGSQALVVGQPALALVVVVLVRRRPRWNG